MNKAHYLSVAFCCCITGVHAQELQEHWWHVNSEVRQLAVDTANGVVYMWGVFDHIGPVLPYGAIVNASSGQPISGSPYFDGVAYEVISDGEGGWYVVGEFEQVAGEARTYFARINGDGSVHPWFSEFSGIVDAMLLDGDVLYLGGGNMTFNGETRRGLAAFSTVDGSLLPWEPITAMTSNSGSVLDIALHGGKLYCAGSFTSINGVPRNNLAAFDRNTAELLPWNPNADWVVDGIVGHQGAVFLTGVFNSIGGVPRHKIAAVDTVSGAVLPWDPQPTQAPGFPGGLGLVQRMRVQDDKLYLGGSFNSLFGEARSRIAVYDLLADELTPWDPGADAFVADMVFAGDTLWMVGHFSTIAGQPRSHVAAFDRTTGELLDVAPLLSETAYAAAISGPNLFLGGVFQSVGGVRRNGSAALDMNTGEATDWAPEVDGPIYAMAVDDGDVILGGSFTSVNGEPRNYFAKVDGISGQLAPIQPVLSGPVFDVLVNDNDLFIAGYFQTVNGQPQNGLAKLHRQTGMLQPWNPGLSGTTESIAMVDNTLYFSCGISSVAGQPCNGIGRLDANSAELIPWDPEINGAYFDIDPCGSEIMLTGAILHESLLYSDAVVLDRFSGEVIPFNPDLFGLKVTYATVGGCHWGKRYVGGEFYTAQGQTSVGFAVFDALTGGVDDWSPDLHYEAVVPVVSAIETRSDLLVLGGTFHMAGNKFRTGIVGFRLPDCSGLVGGNTVPGTPCDDGDPATNNDVWTNACTCAGELTVSVANPDAPVPLAWRYLPDGNIWLDRIADVVLFDALGRQVASHTRTQLIPLAELPSATYLVRTEQGNAFRVIAGR